MKKWLYFGAALILYILIHEYFHVILSSVFIEFDKLIWHWYGPEVKFVTPEGLRTASVKWFLISGTSNFITLAIGYFLFLTRHYILELKNIHWKNLLYYSTIVFLLFDAVNLSVGPILYGGDALGIAAGLNIKIWIVQVIFGIILLINRELIVSFMKVFSVKSKNILFRSWRLK